MIMKNHNLQCLAINTKLNTTNTNIHSYCILSRVFFTFFSLFFTLTHKHKQKQQILGSKQQYKARTHTFNSKCTQIHLTKHKMMLL